MPGDQYKGRFALLFTCFLGIFCSYLVNGLVVEKVARGKAFQFYTSIVLVTTIVNTSVAKIVLLLKARGDEKKAAQERNHLPNQSRTVFLLLTCSLSYVMAMMTANAALKYVNYPTQIVGKSGKPVVILLMSIVLIRRRYTVRKCISTLLVVTGVSMFMLENAKRKQDSLEEHDQNLLGVFLVVISLVFDGIVAVTQEKIRENDKISANVMMYDINKWAACLMFCIATVKGELVPFVTYCRTTDWFLLQMAALCITGVLGQQFIFLTVLNFGPLVCSVITTTRKFFTILLSTLIFQHTLTSKHWACVFMVFFGLAIDLW